MSSFSWSRGVINGVETPYFIEDWEGIENTKKSLSEAAASCYGTGAITIESLCAFALAQQLREGREITLTPDEYEARK